MTSCFLQLFKRGRYVSVRSLAAAEADGSTRERKHEERERFSVAAVAFCLQHDDVFKKHFLKTVAAPKDTYSIALEPEHWGDLVLTGTQYILVLEFKLGALLQEHQSPEARIFETAGYGAKIRKRLPHKTAQHLRYIVIGKEFRRCNRGGLQCSSVPWRRLLVRGGRKESAIERDLYDCLGPLGVPAFLNRNMKKTKLAHDARQALNIYSTLQRVLEKVGLSLGRSEIEPTFCGVEIGKSQRQTTGELQVRLNELVEPDRRALGWIGYELHDGQIFLSVWFYSTPKVASKVLSQLNGKRKLRNWVQEYNNVGLSLPGDESTNDAEWFEKVLKAAGA